ncbi:hypothetical protein BV25DRAFT_1833517 [Artomyces pyxidatus]|uniref:Uncharacterized protein n=1 Tax=Artomyces pyxidatus TaxID=48021 RepID=A0ACB8SFY0_9AGAM|nr:hypothetical protein BV25DRAFT_1833517 [Artomyces pyxidatus]
MPATLITVEQFRCSGPDIAGLVVSGNGSVSRPPSHVSWSGPTKVRSHDPLRSSALPTKVPGGDVDGNPQQAHTPCHFGGHANKPDHERKRGKRRNSGSIDNGPAHLDGSRWVFWRSLFLAFSIPKRRSRARSTTTSHAGTKQRTQYCNRIS